VIGAWRFKALPIGAGTGSIKKGATALYDMLLLLDRLTAKPGGAVNGGRSLFILTVDWLGWVCYL